MTDELPGALGKSGNDLFELNARERSCGHDTNGTISGQHSCCADGLKKRFAKPTQKTHRREAFPYLQSGRTISQPGRKKRIADLLDSASLTCAHQGPEHSGEDMAVFMSVHMGYLDSGRLQAANLSDRLSFDVFGSDAAGYGCQGESYNLAPKLSIFDKGWNL